MTMIFFYLACIICVPVTGIQLSADNINSALGNN
jgi:hypothetical protein